VTSPQSAFPAIDLTEKLSPFLRDEPLFSVTAVRPNVIAASTTAGATFAVATTRPEATSVDTSMAD
jgi:hypothetical protein